MHNFLDTLPVVPETILQSDSASSRPGAPGRRGLWEDYMARFMKPLCVLVFLARVGAQDLSAARQQVEHGIERMEGQVKGMVRSETAARAAQDAAAGAVSALDVDLRQVGSCFAHALLSRGSRLPKKGRKPLFLRNFAKAFVSTRPSPMFLRFHIWMNTTTSRASSTWPRHELRHVCHKNGRSLCYVRWLWQLGTRPWQDASVCHLLA